MDGVSAQDIELVGYHYEGADWCVECGNRYGYAYRAAKYEDVMTVSATMAQRWADEGDRPFCESCGVDIITGEDPDDLDLTTTP